MVNPIVISYETDPELPGVKRFIHSLQRFGWNYHLILEPKWLGFGRRLKKVVEVARELNTKYSHCIHCDARDSLALGSPSEFIAPEVPLLFATEENDWMSPIPRESYPAGTSMWKFTHSQYVLDLQYCDLMKTDTISDIKDDQLHCHELFLFNNHGKIALDYECKYIQSIAFCHPWKNFFNIEKDRIRNILTNSVPLFLHANGKTDYSWSPNYAL